MEQPTLRERLCANEQGLTDEGTFCAETSKAVAVLFMETAHEADEGLLVVDRRARWVSIEPVAEILMEGLIVPTRTFGAQRGEGCIGEFASGRARGKAGDCAADDIPGVEQGLRIGRRTFAGGSARTVQSRNLGGDAHFRSRGVV